MESSVPVRRRSRQVDEEVDVLAARVDEMEMIMARTFDGDESSSDAESCHPSSRSSQHNNLDATVLGPVAISSRRSRALVLLVRAVRATEVVLGLSSVHTAAPPQGRSGGSSRSHSFSIQQQRVGEAQHRPFQQPGPSRFGQSSQPQFSGPQHAQVNAMTREQVEGTPGGVIAGYQGFSAGRGDDSAGGAPREDKRREHLRSCDVMPLS
ncbi:hypothetical protein F511_24051 [Dorcoceras hygrometricum]|uniref:Uncharacterized protein n=1 Tax=Dorcoceras hygrometricum TaxID=472368 RepID=A0A2Z7A2R9_9LAMI|nr:hypothetical protein F511_24051 [Dorcoceras hygrometricum]